MNKSYLIYKKELLEIFKDKKTLFMTVFFPVILYPLLILISSLLAVKGQDKINKTVSEIAFEKSIDSQLIKLLNDNKNLKIINVTDFKKEITDKKLDAYINFDSKTKEFEIYYNSTKDESSTTVDRIKKSLTEYRELKQGDFLTQKGISQDFLKNYSIKENNLASQEKKTNQILGIVLPFIIIFPLMQSVFFSALDLTSGEKERKTMETLLILPVKKESIMLAKLCAVVTMGIISATINFLGIVFTYMISKNFIPQVDEYIGKGIDFKLIATLLIMIIPLIFIIAGIGLIVGLFSKDYKDSQNYMTPIMIVMMLPIYFVVSPGWKLEGLITSIPVLNIFLLFKSLGLGEVNFNQIFIVFLTNIGAATILVITFIKLFKSEAILFVNERGFDFSFKRIRKWEKKGLEISEVVLIYIIIMTLLITVGAVLQLKLGVSGIFLSQVLLILLPVILIVRFLNLDYKSIFIVKKIKIKDLLGSVSLWMFTLLVVNGIGQIQLKLFPSQLKDLELLNDFFKDTKIWQQILIFSLTPAICEEILFRGLIFRSLKEKIDVKYAIILSGILFGIFHIYPGKMLVTAILGMLFAYIYNRTGTILTSMFLHFINNSYAFVLSATLIKYQKNMMLMGVISIIILLIATYGIYWFSKGFDELQGEMR